MKFSGVRRTATGKFRVAVEGKDSGILFGTAEEADEHLWAAMEAMDAPETCPLCDGFHTGFCPLEDRGDWDSVEDARERFLESLAERQAEQRAEDAAERAEWRHEADMASRYGYGN